LGGVRDMAPVNDKYHPQGILIRNFSEKYLNNGPYINSGVLLINLKKIAEYENLLFETKVPLYYPDQDLLNAAFAGKIKILPLKYNLAPGIPVPTIFKPDEVHEAMLGGHVIIHCYSVKPFDYEHAPEQLYKIFSEHATNIGMDPKMFLEQEKQHEAKRIKDTFIPNVKIQNNMILFYHDGEEIKIKI